jgi:hypothetical protein
MTLLFASCKNGDEDPKPNTDPKSLVVTGVSGITKANIGVLLYEKEAMEAWIGGGRNPANMPVPIAGSLSNQTSGEVNFTLYKITGTLADWGWNATDANKWKETGKYYATIVDTDDTSFFNTGDVVYAREEVIEYFSKASETVDWGGFKLQQY